MLIPWNDYRRWDAVEMSRLVRDGEVCADDLAETARARMEELGRLNAVADLADRDTGSDTDAGPGPDTTGALAGVSFAVKELLAWPGLPWTMGSRLMAANPAPGRSPYAERIAGSGLNVLCSTASSEFGLLGSTESALRGPTLNPWREGLSAGGSSGGSAALVAARVIPMAHGDDAGGSLRVPAALNGAFGFKPSNRRCAPAWPDAPGFATLVVEHCVSRSVRDSAAFLAVTERTGQDAAYPPDGQVRGPDSARLRISVLTPILLGRDPDKAVIRELDAAAALCERLGHHVDAAEPPAVDGQAASDGFFTGAALAMAQMSRAAAQALGRRPGPSELEPFTLELIEWAASLGPALARVSWPLGHLSPAAGDDGLPVGIHFAARPGADRLLLALAYELEAAAPWSGRVPGTSWLTGRP
ncbi:MAG: amidase family protein [Trebonia sp.]